MRAPLLIAVCLCMSLFSVAKTGIFQPALVAPGAQTMTASPGEPRLPVIPGTVQYKLIPDSSLVVWYCQENNQVHSGGFMFSSGSFTLVNGSLNAGNFELDMKSLVDNDLRNPDQNTALVSRLKSADLFNTSDYPRANFVITKVVVLKGQQYELEANMTIKGHTRQVRMQVAIAIKGSMLEIVSTDMLIEGVQFGLKTGVHGGATGSELRDFKIKISQLYAKH